MLIALYLIAIVAANFLAAQVGPSVTVVNAFLFIGLDLTARDALHERWERRHLWRNMALLIATGSVLSAALNWQAAPIALASFLAFAASGLADTVAYTLLRRHARLLRVNGSNVVSAAVDSVVFPALAFGLPLLVPVMIGQFAAKVVGGLVWSLVLRRTK